MGIDSSRGFVAIPRGLTDWEWYSEPNTARLFIHLLLTANWSQKQWQGITIHPGELVTSQSQLAKAQFEHYAGANSPETPRINRIHNSQNRVEIQPYHVE